MLHFVRVVAVIVCAGAMLGAGPATPQAAREAYDNAMFDGDAAKAKQLAVYDADWEKVIESGAAAEAGMTKLRAESIKRWGDAAKKEFPEPRRTEVPDTKYEINGDKAVLKFHGTAVKRFRKTEDGWKVDLLTPVSDLYRDDPAQVRRSYDAYGKAAIAIAERVAKGEFANPQQAREAFDDLHAVLFNPASAATRPGATTRP